MSETASKVRVMTDCHIRIEPRGINVYRFQVTPERTYAMVLSEKYEEWAKDFHSFLRDHRSQDVQSIDVVPEYQDQCSACGAEWEPMGPDEDCTNTTCSNCGAYISGPNPPVAAADEAKP